MQDSKKLCSRGYTLIELIISVGFLILLVVGVSALFS